MKPKIGLQFLAVLAAAGLTGCAYSDRPRLGETFGDAVHQNMAVHIIDPEPAPIEPAAEMDGARANLAITRYQANRVIAPRTLRTATIGTAGAGGGGGGGQ